MVFNFNIPKPCFCEWTKKKKITKDKELYNIKASQFFFREDFSID